MLMCSFTLYWFYTLSLILLICALHSMMLIHVLSTLQITYIIEPDIAAALFSSYCYEYRKRRKLKHPEILLPA